MDLKASFQDVIKVKALTLIGAVYAQSPVLKSHYIIGVTDVSEEAGVFNLKNTVFDFHRHNFVLSYYRPVGLLCAVA